MQPVLVAAGVACVKHDLRTELAKLDYVRALVKLFQKQKNAPESELDQYFVLFNQLTGADLSVDRQWKDKVKAGIDAYERYTGYKIGSKELDAAVERTIKDMGG